MVIVFDHLERAIKWDALLRSHAEMIYSTITDREERAATVLIEKISAGGLPDGFTVRDVHRKGWSGLTKDTTPDVVYTLVEHGYLVEAVDKKAAGGRPTARFYINPAVVV